MSKVLTLLASLVAFTSASENPSNRLGCTANLDGYYFNLFPLSKPLDDENRFLSNMYKVDYEDANGTASIEFNLCEKTANQCPDEMNDYAHVTNGVGTCNHLSRTLESNTGEPGDLSLISKTAPDMGVIMTYEGGNMCDETEHYALIVQINCNPNIEKTTYSLDKESVKNPCKPRVIMNSPHACPVLTTGALGTFVQKGRFFIAIPMILLGGYLLAVGGRYPNVTLALFSTVSVAFGLLCWLYIGVFPANVPSWTVWILGFVCLGLGAGLGFGAGRWPLYGIAVMAFSVGSLFGMLLYRASMHGKDTPTYSKWLLIFGVAVFSMLFCIFLFDYAVIITSAIFGAVFLVRGLSMIIGGYTNEFELVLAGQNGELGHVRWTQWLYWLAMVFLIIGGLCAQLGDRKKHLEMYTYKSYYNSNMETYQSMREKMKYQGRSYREGGAPYSDAEMADQNYQSRDEDPHSENEGEADDRKPFFKVAGKQRGY